MLCVCLQNCFTKVVNNKSIKKSYTPAFLPHLEVASLRRSQEMRFLKTRSLRLSGVSYLTVRTIRNFHWAAITSVIKNSNWLGYYRIFGNDQTSRAGLKPMQPMQLHCAPCLWGPRAMVFR